MPNNNDKGLKGAIASTKLEGINIDDKLLEMVEIALRNNKKDASLLYSINKMLKEKESKNEKQK